MIVVRFDIRCIPSPQTRPWPRGYLASPVICIASTGFIPPSLSPYLFLAHHFSSLLANRVTTYFLVLEKGVAILFSFIFSSLFNILFVFIFPFFSTHSVTRYWVLPPPPALQKIPFAPFPAESAEKMGYGSRVATCTHASHQK